MYQEARQHGESHKLRVLRRVFLNGLSVHQETEADLEADQEEETEEHGAHPALGDGLLLFHRLQRVHPPPAHCVEGQLREKGADPKGHDDAPDGISRREGRDVSAPSCAA